MLKICSSILSPRSLPEEQKHMQNIWYATKGHHKTSQPHGQHPTPLEQPGASKRWRDIQHHQVLKEHNTFSFLLLQVIQYRDFGNVFLCGCWRIYLKTDPIVQARLHRSCFSHIFRRWSLGRLKKQTRFYFGTTLYTLNLPSSVCGYLDCSLGSAFCFPPLSLLFHLPEHTGDSAVGLSRFMWNAFWSVACPVVLWPAYELSGLHHNKWRPTKSKIKSLYCHSRLQIFRQSIQSLMHLVVHVKSTINSCN